MFGCISICLPLTVSTGDGRSDSKSVRPVHCVCLEWQMYNFHLSCTNCLMKQFIWRVKARRINIQRVESLSYAGVTPRSISKLSAIGGWFRVI